MFINEKVILSSNILNKSLFHVLLVFGPRTIYLIKTRSERYMLQQINSYFNAIVPYFHGSMTMTVCTSMEVSRDPGDLGSLEVSSGITALEYDFYYLINLSRWRLSGKISLLTLFFLNASYNNWCVLILNYFLLESFWILLYKL